MERARAARRLKLILSALLDLMTCSLVAFVKELKGDETFSFIPLHARSKQLTRRVHVHGKRRRVKGWVSPRGHHSRSRGDLLHWNPWNWRPERQLPQKEEGAREDFNVSSEILALMCNITVTTSVHTCVIWYSRVAGEHF